MRKLFSRPRGRFVSAFVLTIAMFLPMSLLTAGSAQAAAGEPAPQPTAINDGCGTANDTFTYSSDVQWLFSFESAPTQYVQNNFPTSSGGSLSVRLIAQSFADGHKEIVTVSFTDAGQPCVQAADSVTFTVGECDGVLRPVWVNYTNVADNSEKTGPSQGKLYVEGSSVTAGTRTWDASASGAWLDGETRSFQLQVSEIEIRNGNDGFYPGNYAMKVFINGDRVSPRVTGSLVVDSCGTAINQDAKPDSPTTESSKPSAAIKWLKKGRVLKATLVRPTGDETFTYRVYVTQRGVKRTLVKVFAVKAGAGTVVKRINTKRFLPGRPRSAVVSYKKSARWQPLKRAVYRR